jgi:hypothetical protein
MGNQFVGYTITEILLFGVVTHVIRRKNGNRGVSTFKMFEKGLTQ